MRKAETLILVMITAYLFGCQAIQYSSAMKHDCGLDAVIQSRRCREQAAWRNLYPTGNFVRCEIRGTGGEMVYGHIVEISESTLVYYADSCSKATRVRIEEIALVTCSSDTLYPIQ